MAFDPKRYTNLEWAILGSGVVALISLFLPWYGVSYLGFDATVSGWNVGFFGWFGALLLVAAAVYTAVRKMDMSVPRAPWGASTTTAIVSVVGLVLVLLRWLTLPHHHFGTRAIKYGGRIGLWLAILAGIVEVVAAVMLQRSSGESLPWESQT